MAEQAGLGLLIKAGADGSEVTLAGLRSNSFTINNELVDVTNKTSNRMRELLSGAGVRSLTISGSGVASDEAGYTAVKAAAIADTHQRYLLCYSDGSTIAGNFQITSFESAGEYNAEETFSITLESSGAYTYTAA